MSLNRLFVLGMLMNVVLTAQWKPADPPAESQSGMPFLTSGADGTVYLSWIQPLSKADHALRYARWNGAGWSGAETIATGRQWFVNWADFPALQVMPDGSMLAHWLARPEGGGKYGYGIRIARRSPGPSGKWIETAAINENDSSDYAGFLSFSGPAAAYLSPPTKQTARGAHDGHRGEGEHIKTLRFVRFEHDGRIAADQELDSDVCSCCQTSMARTSFGMLVAYRDHLPGEIRDISIVRLKDGKWSKPATLHPDGWKINGCPTEGPSIAASGRTVGIAWMTRAGDIPRLQIAFSSDGGERFDQPIRADDSDPLGRPGLVPIDERQCLLVWLEKTASGADVRVRRVFADGGKAASVTIAKVAASRASGLPKIVVSRDRLFVAWRDERVRAGWLPIKFIPKERKK